MSRSGYSDDCYDQWAMIRYAGAVTQATFGKKGQAFLKETLAALDALPEKKLISNELVTKSGEVCALGSVAVARGIDVSDVDPHDWEKVAATFGITNTLAREIMYANDDAWVWTKEMTPELRFETVRQWIIKRIIKVEANADK